jgi:macrodomain Ter protein organizer (MatP/YcbG family)
MPRRKSDLRKHTVWLSDAVWARIEKLALEKGYTTSDLVRRALTEMLEKLEASK